MVPCILGGEVVNFQADVAPGEQIGGAVSNTAPTKLRILLEVQIFHAIDYMVPAS